MTDPSNKEQLLKPRDVVRKSVSTPTRELSVAGMVVILTFWLAAGICCSVVYHVAKGDAGTLKWKVRVPASTVKVEVDALDPYDPPILNVFKMVNLLDLEDSLHLMAATKALLNSDYERALSEVNSVSPAHRKRDPGCTTLEIECLLSLKRAQQVIQLTESHMKLSPHDYSGWLWRGEAYEQLKDYKKALADYTKALELFTYAKKALSTKLSPVHIERYEEMIASQAYRRIGSCYERIGDYKTACQYYERSIRLTNARLGSTLTPDKDSKSVSQAKKNIIRFSEALNSDSENSDLHLLRAHAYKQVGKFDQALDDYEKVKKSDSVLMHYEKAGANYGLGNFKFAAYDLRKVHSDDPLYEMPHMRHKKFSFAIIPVTLMKKSEVLSVFDKHLISHPNDAETYYQRGVLQFAFREYEDGAQDLEQYLSRRENKKTVTTTKSLIFLALSRGLCRRKNECQLLLERAVEASDNQKWWHSISMFLAGQTVTESALLEAVKTNKLRAAQAHYYIGQSYLLKGLKDKADENFQAAIDTGVGARVDEYYLAKLALVAAPEQHQGSMMSR
ncbi:MAG: tetratricopeptide repeat protein [Candidatus Obscuribacterales bacterium]|nr:tetratricopeptide repeat protein [Candidatus Obscuribacterales bacterium]